MNSVLSGFIELTDISLQKIDTLRIVHLAVEVDTVCAGTAVLGDHDRDLVAFVHEFRGPVENLRRDRPLQCSQRLAGKLTVSFRSRELADIPHRCIDIHAVEVQRRLDDIPLFLGEIGKISAEEFFCAVRELS